MKRTQVYFPDELHEAVRRLAFEQRRSMADVVREAVASYIDAANASENRPSQAQTSPLESSGSGQPV